MFSVFNQVNNNFNKVVLKDNLSQTYVEILPDCGGIIHSFNVLYGHDFLNVIANYDSEQDFKNNVTSKGCRGCKLSPFACRIKDGTYEFAGNVYTIGKFIIDGSALHGFLFDEPFAVKEIIENDEEATVSLLYSYDGRYPGFPFKYDCEIIYSLMENSMLKVQTIITNKNNGLMPIQDGWHPYFTFGNGINDLLLEFQSTHKVVFDDKMIPTGELVAYEEFGSLKTIGEQKFDDCFALDYSECQPMCVIRDKEKKLQVEIFPDKSYPYLQIYTPDDRQSIAIENLSAVPDAFNNGMGLKVMQIHESATFITAYKVSAIK